MKKIINHPADAVEEMLEGISAVHPSILYKIQNTRVLASKYKNAGKVGLVSGGGSGHEPSHAGFVGKGMLSAAVCGDVFTSPSPDQILEAIKAAEQGAGVFLIIKNYSGDVMNFEMAKELAEMEDIQVDYAIVDDDIAVEDSTYTSGRRGVAGTIFVHKILGAAAEQGYSLQEIKQLSEQLIPNIKTLGLALSPATVPEVGKPGFSLDEDEIEFGIGIHGEPGYRREKLQPSKELALELYEKIKKELSLTSKDQVVILVNGMGSTPLMEQYIFAKDVMSLLTKDKITVSNQLVGNYMTAIDMAGISLTILRLKDSKWLEWINQPVETIAW